MIEQEIDQYCVVGNPIEHSKSPIIHSLFAKQVGELLNYERQLVPVDQFESSMNKLFANGLRGANVTLPFKERAYEWAGRRTEQAELAKAVNTLFWDGNVIVGDNTDGVGLIRDIKDNHCGRLEGAKVLIVGAGGAVRGVLGPVLSENPAEVVIVNRTVDKAVKLCSDFSGVGQIQAVSYTQLSQYNAPFDWIINGTSTGIDGAIPPLQAHLIGPDTHCYDMFYNSDITPFNRWCKESGARHCFDGLGMLVEQAAESFYIWRQIMPETSPVLSGLRSG